MSLESEGKGKEMRGCVSLEFLLRTDNGQRTTGTRGVLRGPRGPKNNFVTSRELGISIKMKWAMNL